MPYVLLSFVDHSLRRANLQNKTYTHGAELPAVLVLTPLQGQDADGGDVWAVDSDKAYDIENALSDYVRAIFHPISHNLTDKQGRVLEKQLTAEDDDFARFLRSAPDSAVPQEERTEAEAYRYRQAGSILMRSQLDCHDPRLPGTGVFDIKTRACHPLRHDRANVEQASGHDVYRERGMGNTFERELYDLVRSAMLKFRYVDVVWLECGTCSGADVQHASEDWRYGRYLFGLPQYRSHVWLSVPTTVRSAYST